MPILQRDLSEHPGPRRSPAASRRTALGALGLLGAVTLASLGGGPALAQVAPAQAPGGAAPVSIDVVTINDFHGRLEAGGEQAGAAVIAGAVQQRRAANPNTIFAGAGDLIGASTFTSAIQEDVPTIDALNAAGLEVSAAGNHEFDRGWADLAGRVRSLADWEYLSANVVHRASGLPVLAPSWVTERAGIRVGFVGAVTEDLPRIVTPSGLDGLETRDLVASVNAAVAELRDGDPGNGEADVVILLVHEGAATTQLDSITPDSPLGRIAAGVTRDVAAIVSAHTHLAYSHVIDGRPVVSSGQYGENLGLLTLEMDPEERTLRSISNRVLPLTEGGVPRYPADPRVSQIVADAVREAAVLGSRRVGEITADLNRARQSTGEENRGAESTLSNFVAELMRRAADADVALMNPGGVRDDLRFVSADPGVPDGTVTYSDVATVLSFANPIVTTTLTGAQLTAVLEEQWQPLGTWQPVRKLGLSAGLSYTYDPSAPDGARITEVTLHGNILAPTAQVTVAANPLLAGGGDHFFTMAAGTRPRDSGRIDTQAMVDWFTEYGVVSPDLAKRSVGVTVSAPAGQGFAPGEEITVALSSLAWSAGEPQPASASIALNGVELARAPIDPAVVDGTPEGGRATLRFAAPAGITGTQRLTVTVAGQGTTASVPVVFAAAPGPTPDPTPDPSRDPSRDPDGEVPPAPGVDPRADPRAEPSARPGSGPGALAATGAPAPPLLAGAGILVLLGAALQGFRRPSPGNNRP